MSGHEFPLNSEGHVVRVSESAAPPYCIYVECLRCGGIFCDNGCDGDIWNVECPSPDVEMFPAPTAKNGGVL